MIPHRRWIFTLSLLVALGGSSCAGEQSAPQKEAHAEQGADDEHQEGVVAIAPEAQAQVGLQVAPVIARELPAVFTTTGEFEADADRVAHVTARVPGRVTQVFMTIGDPVNAGQPLATLDSVELGQTQSAYLTALAGLDLARETLARQERLLADDLIARKEVIQARNEVRLARVELEEAQSQLRLYGMTAARVATLARTRRIDPTIPLLAPIGGVVLQRHLTLGEVVEPGAPQPAFVLTNVEELWVNATLYEKDLALVREGQPATVTTPAYPSERYQGRVSVISTALEKETRTATARVVVANPQGKLKPDMFANVSIDVGSRQALAIPESALVQDKGETYVFVRTGPTTFERREVALDEKVGGYYPVRSGLAAGEPVVTKGAFNLKAELTKESFGGHGH